MKVLVTGVAGFVGSALAKTLVSQGDYVVGVDALTDYYSPHIKKCNICWIGEHNFEFHQGDINTMDLGNILHDVDVVLHQAGQPGVRRSWGKEFANYTSDNVLATQRLLEAAKDMKGLKRFVYASSSSVYGNAEGYPTHESALPAPISPYGVTKLAAEQLVSLYGKCFGVPTISLRYFTVYGPRQRPDMAFARFVRASLTGEEIRVFGDGTQIRDFTFVDDVVKANTSAVHAETEPGTVVNIAGGSHISINETLDVLAELRGKPLNVAYSPPQSGDVWRTSGSTERAERLLGWTPVVSIYDGLRIHREWMEHEQQVNKTLVPQES